MKTVKSLGARFTLHILNYFSIVTKAHFEVNSQSYDIIKTKKNKLHLSMNKFEERSRYLTETSMLLLEPGLAIKIMLSKNAIPLSTLTSLIPLIVFYSAL